MLRLPADDKRGGNHRLQMKRIGKPTSSSESAGQSFPRQCSNAHEDLRISAKKCLIGRLHRAGLPLHRMLTSGFALFWHIELLSIGFEELANVF